MVRYNDDEYMHLAILAKEGSTCMRRQVGAILVGVEVKHTSGCNGVPKDCQECRYVGCVRQNLNIPSGERHELCRGVHAEQLAIINAAKQGIPLKGAILYTTLFPCIACTKMIIAAGIFRVVYKLDYNDDLAHQMMNESSVRCVKYK